MKRYFRDNGFAFGEEPHALRNMAVLLKAGSSQKSTTRSPAGQAYSRPLKPAAGAYLTRATQSARFLLFIHYELNESRGQSVPRLHGKPPPLGLGLGGGCRPACWLAGTLAPQEVRHDQRCMAPPPAVAAVAHARSHPLGHRHCLRRHCLRRWDHRCCLEEIGEASNIGVKRQQMLEHGVQPLRVIVLRCVLSTGGDGSSSNLINGR